MARVRIDPPEQVLFTTQLVVRIDDVNYGGHMGNDAILRYAHEVRLQFLQHFGMTEMDAGGEGIIMADAAISYKSEAFHGDVLQAQIGIRDFSNFGCDLVYRFMHADGRDVALVKTGIVFFDYDKRELRPVPADFRTRLKVVM